MFFRRKKPAPAPRRSPLHQMLIHHLYFKLNEYPGNRRWNSQWVMDSGWFEEIKRIMPLNSRLPRPIWEPPHTTLFGIPVVIRDGSGLPHLEDRGV